MLTDIFRPAERVPTRRVHTANGSHIEPELSRDLTDLAQAEWLASVVEGDTGLPIRFGPGSWTRNGRRQPGMICVQVGSSSSVYPVSELWEFLTAVSLGAEQVIDERRRKAWTRFHAGGSIRNGTLVIAEPEDRKPDPKPVHVKSPNNGGTLVYHPDEFGGNYALAIELTEGFEDIGDYWRTTTGWGRRNG